MLTMRLFSDMRVEGWDVVSFVVTAVDLISFLGQAPNRLFYLSPIHSNKILGSASLEHMCILQYNVPPDCGAERRSCR